MGKISNALSKYAKERREIQRQSAPPIMLNQDDVRALLKYDRNTGHLLRYDEGSGEVDPQSIEALRNQGTIQRLLDSKLIYPSGKLTPRGLKECRRLEAELDQRPIIRPTATGVPERAEAELQDEPLIEALQAEGPPQRTVSGDESTSDFPQKLAEAELRDEPLIEALQVEGALPEAESVDERESDFLPGPRQSEEPVYDDEATAPDDIDKDDLLPSYETLAERQATRPEVKRPAGRLRPVFYNEKAIDPNLVSLHMPHSFEAEQFKILRTNILFPVAGKPPRSILITSTGPGEGKTFVAANLAVSIALNINKHVLLIDGDLRKPELHRRFGFGKIPGLRNYLTENTALSSLLVKTKVEKLTLLPAGEPPDNPSELISSEQMAQLLAEVTNRYRDRLIVIDSPPPRMAAETGVLARQVDGILVVVSYGKTRKEDAADLIEKMGKEKVLGSVINYIDPNATRRYGYGKYGYYGPK